MDENEYKVAGFCFSDSHDYKEALREVESVEYIKANTDLSDLNKAVKLYNKLVERKTLKTVVGYAFLKELQERIINEGILNKNNIPCINVVKSTKQIKAYSDSIEHNQEQKHQEIVMDYRIRLRNSRIISAFLVAIIIIMILISIFSNRSLFTNYEEQILNKYSSWEEDLTAREKAIQQKEDLKSED